MFLQEQITRLQNGANPLPPITANTAFTKALQQIEPISLEKLTQASLMNRIDTKFFFPADYLPKLLTQIQEHYYVLDMGGLRCIPYESLYYDTPRFDLYLQHHNGKGNRHKMRYRRYANTNKTFFEVKLKTHKGRTVKTRINVPAIYSNLDENAAQLLRQQTNLAPQAIEPVIWIDYYRITLVAQNFSERVTIDMGLRFHNYNNGVKWQNVCILEVKQSRANRHSPIIEALKKMHILPKSLSKYCIGIALTYPALKHNQFKSKLLQIEKIEHPYADSPATGTTSTC